jgi:hypothetical protein
MSKSTSLEAFNCKIADLRDNHVHNIREVMRQITVNVDFSKQWMEYQTSLFDGLRDNSPIQQETLLSIITAFLKDNNLKEIEKNGKGQVWYLFANAVASYSSYNRYYWISKEAMKVLDDEKINTFPVTRSKIFQIRDDDRKKVLTFEHMCPATQLIKFLLSAKAECGKHPDDVQFEGEIKKIMDDYGLVAIITKEEDKKLSGNWKSKVNEKFSDIPLERMLNRYENEKVKIELEDKIIPVYGKMYR